MKCKSIKLYNLIRKKDVHEVFLIVILNNTFNFFFAYMISPLDKVGHMYILLHLNELFCTRLQLIVKFTILIEHEMEFSHSFPQTTNNFN